jgi:hypothetical protein
MKNAPKGAKDCAAWAFAHARRHPEVRPGHVGDANTALRALVAGGWIRTAKERNAAMTKEIAEYCPACGGPCRDESTPVAPLTAKEEQ